MVSGSCSARDLTNSLHVDKSASCPVYDCPVYESTSLRFGSPQVGVSGIRELSSNVSAR